MSEVTGRAVPGGADGRAAEVRAASAACSTTGGGTGAGPDALEYLGVSFGYGAGRVLDDLTLAVPEGGVHGIVGPNGCGKSTLLKLADALIEPQAGEVRVCGRGVAGLAARERAQLVALLPQVHRTPSMTVRDLVMCGRYAHMGVFGRPGADDRRAVEEAMAEVGILDLAAKPARALSGGERQRAFLAMAVAQDARVLMLDEPTTYLDVRAAAETMALARQLSASRSTTVVAVIHDLDLALRSCDTLTVLAGGRVLAQGTSDSAAVVSAIEDAFGVECCRSETPRGVAWSFFPRA